MDLRYYQLTHIIKSDVESMKCTMFLPSLFFSWLNWDIKNVPIKSGDGSFSCRYFGSFWGYKHTTCWQSSLFSSFRLEDQTKKLHKDMKKSTEADLGLLPARALICACSPTYVMLAALLRISGSPNRRRSWFVLKLEERVLTFVLMLQVCCFLTSCLVCFYSFGVFVLVFVEFFTLPYFFFLSGVSGRRR